MHIHDHFVDNIIFEGIRSLTHFIVIYCEVKILTIIEIIKITDKPNSFNENIFEMYSANLLVQFISTYVRKHTQNWLYIDHQFLEYTQGHII